jgi:hypothetical protein
VRYCKLKIAVIYKNVPVHKTGENNSKLPVRTLRQKAHRHSKYKENILN